MPSLLRRSLAEALGTFVLVFIGVGSVASKNFPGADYGILGVAVAHGLALAVMVTATMNISGGHLNPAVTLALLAARRTNARTAGAYIVAQLVGAVLAAVFIGMVYPAPVVRSIAAGTPTIAGTILLSQAILIEAAMAFILVSAVFGSCVNPDAPRVGGFAIGLALLVDILVGGPLTGAAVNPARAFGPALVSGQWVGHIAYWVGPILGGVAAGLVWEHLLLKKRESERK
ncbi:MAG: aquaporin [Gemmatimonadales bacterium]|nr:aquaporin [Gemmatimonadales bacterium]MDQ3427867.1 aquaporin [Gemmatimonadota bacterium]